MKLLSLIGALLSIILPARADDSAPPPPPSVVGQLGDMMGARCTAFFIGRPDLVVTAGHCVFATGIALKDFVFLPDSRKAPDDLLPLTIAAASNPSGGLEDWAIFRITPANIDLGADAKVAISHVPDGWKGATLDCHYVPQTGARVTASGYPAVNGNLTLMMGYINGPEAAFNSRGEGLIPITMAVSGGASGSPVFEPDGRVIGILVDENSTQEAWAYVTPITPICNALHMLDGAA